MTNPQHQIMDALDVETFFVCDNEQQGRHLMLSMLKNWGFTDVDIVFAQHIGPGTRIRGRAYAYRPSDKYTWLLREAVKGEQA
ncbi:hypothetical protein SOV_27380 [Sporomusa ovata DSM 2662]|uniref:Uncharacterized protein n=1 Tax=Sporomusa ovata TaxID=2378 RepID=A0A0U1L5R2_9FIRM|nr:hypothetical protein [Sporomusa ovata]EQB26053.1 hypothetical protein SOV_4c07200 [Sporomusa ovata DSM 2662]CQR74629.1 hypothetical protein SpAn4DRAFT_1091 [Sporomusa ovata]